MADVAPAAGADQSPSPRLHHLVLYDGVCGLCNGLVRFILARDPLALFQFAALQSAPARDVLRGFGKTPDGLNTFFVVADTGTARARLLDRSEAVLFVAAALGPPWRWLAPLKVLPVALRDSCYNLVARNRYRLFGKHDTCPLPTAETRRRFLDL